jgi:hypothetical protein
MDEVKLKGLIRAAVGPDGKIRCAEAFRVAQEAGVPVGEVGRLINELKIKIKGCQLGCF